MGLKFNYFKPAHFYKPMFDKINFIYTKNTTNKKRKFSTVDILVPIPMKNAAKCDKQCELQNSASHQIFERKWRWFIQHVYFSVLGIKHHNAIDIVKDISR